jgi:hypothetical protein
MIDENLTLATAPDGPLITRRHYREEGGGCLQGVFDFLPPILAEAYTVLVSPYRDVRTQTIDQVLAKTLFQGANPFRAIVLRVAEEQVVLESWNVCHTANRLECVSLNCNHIRSLL